KFQTLLKVMQSKEIKAYIKKEYGDDVIPYENK
ncbi:MAG: methionine ABC transporter substrate-binding protein, partial [Staphylococcus hominis]